MSKCFMIFFFLFTFFLTLLLTLAVKRIVRRLQIVDQTILDRKIHTAPIPLLGGAAVFLGFFMILAVSYFWQPGIFIHLSGRQLSAIFGGCLILMIGGFLDDKYNLRPRSQIIFPILAALIIIYFGTNLKEITNPFGGTFKLTFGRFGSHFLLVEIITFFWLMGMMYTTKLLDGLDGLVTGLTAIGSLMIFFLCLTPRFYQIDVAQVALIFAAANLGFLIFNFYPAKIFLGEGGSLMTGFVLGVLSIVAGGKIATALLVFGIAALDIVVVVLRRLKKKQPIFSGDSGHLHFRLLQAGLNQRQVVLLFYLLAIIFGILTLFLQSKGKFFAIIILFLIALGVGVIVDKKKN